MEPVIILAEHPHGVHSIVSVVVDLARSRALILSVTHRISCRIRGEIRTLKQYIASWNAAKCAEAIPDKASVTAGSVNDNIASELRLGM